MEAFSLQKVEMLEEVVVDWQEVRWVWRMRQNLGPDLFNFWSLDRVACWEELDPCCWPMPAAGGAVFGASRFAERISQMWWFHCDSESFSGSDRQQTTKQWPWPLFWCRFGFGKSCGAASQSRHWAGHHPLSYKIHFLSHITIPLRSGSMLLRGIREDSTSKWRVFWFWVSSWGTHLIEPFHLSSLLQMPNNWFRMVDVEFFASFLYSGKRSASMILSPAAAKSLQSCPTRCNPIDGSPPGSAIPGILQERVLEWVAIAFSGSSQLVVVSFQWPATVFLIFKALVSFAKLLEPPLLYIP